MSWHTPQDWAGLSSAEILAKNIALGRPSHVSPEVYWPESKYYNPKLTNEFLISIGQKTEDFIIEDPKIGNLDPEDISPKALKLHKLDLKKRFPNVDPKYIDDMGPLPNITIGLEGSQGEHYSGDYTPYRDENTLMYDTVFQENPDLKAKYFGKDGKSGLVALHTQKDTMIESGEWDKLDTIAVEHFEKQINQEQKSGQTFGNVIEKNQVYEMKLGPTHEMKLGPTHEMKLGPTYDMEPVQNINESKAETKILNQHDMNEKTFKSLEEAKMLNQHDKMLVGNTENEYLAASGAMDQGIDNSKSGMSNLKNDGDATVGTAGDSDAVDGAGADEIFSDGDGSGNAAYDNFHEDGARGAVGDGNGGAAAFSTSKPKKKKQKTKTVMGTKNVGENVLYNLEPYTYEFTLSAMSKEDYAKGGSYEIPSRKNIIIKTSGLPKGPSGGASDHANEFAGWQPGELAPGSQLNHHVRNVSLKSVIGLNSKTITSNVHNIEFSVFEPFGASLLDDLHDAAVSVGFDNYLRGIYLLTLKFHGYNDDGKPTHPAHGIGRSKFFPMKIINCDLNIKTGGTEYNFSAVPYNANSLEDTRLKITQPMVLRGSSAGELLFELQNQLNEQQRILWDKGEGGYSIQIVGNPDAVTTGDINTDQKIELANTEALKGTPESIFIGPGGEQGKNASDLFSASMNHDKFSESANKDSVELTAEGKKLIEETMNPGVAEGRIASNLKFNSLYNRRVYTWNTGTSVLDIIQAIVESSDYIIRQVKTDANEMNVQANSNGQIPWYKIDYKFVDANDNKTPNRYLIRPYMVDQYIALPDSATNKKFNVKDVAREYNYIYTGKNRDILDFDLQYNFAFFTSVSAHADKTPASTSSSIAHSKVITKKNKHLTSPKNRDKGKVVIETKLSDTDARGTTQGGELGSAHGYKQASIIKEQLSNPMGDLINLELEILGDPFYLVQEDFNPGLLPRDEDGAEYELKDGSIDVNSGEVYLKVNFKTPVDLDEETGTFKGINGAGKYDTSFFGGFFKLISIESTFEEGRFIQRLGMVRLRYQELEAPKGTPEERAHAGEFEWPIDSSKGYKDVHNFNVSFSNVIKGLDTAFNLGPITGEPFSVGSFSKEETQTEANIEDGFHSAMTTQQGDLASIGIDQNNLLGNFASGGNPVDGVMSFAKADQKRKNGASNVLSTDKGEGQSNVVSGFDEPKKMGMMESFAAEKGKFNQSLPGKDAGQAEFGTMQKDMGGMGLNFDMFSGGGSNNFLMGGGNPVNNLLAFAKKDQKSKNEVVKEVKEEGKKTTIKKEEKIGNKIKKTEEIIIENDSGEPEITTTEETIGTDKYLGMTREQYYAGWFEPAGKFMYRSMRWRNIERIQEEGQAMGLSEKEIQAEIKAWKKSNPNPAWEERKNEKNSVHG